MNSGDDQQPAPDEVAEQLIEQMGDRYAVAVANEIKRLAYVEKEDTANNEDAEQQDSPRRGYNVPADSASMRGYISARGAA